MACCCKERTYCYPVGDDPESSLWKVTFTFPDGSASSCTTFFAREFLLPFTFKREVTCGGKRTTEYQYFVVSPAPPPFETASVSIRLVLRVNDGSGQCACRVQAIADGVFASHSFELQYISVEEGWEVQFGGLCAFSGQNFNPYIHLERVDP